MGMKARAGDVAEEVRLALGARRVKLRRFLAHALEHGFQGLGHGWASCRKATCLELADAGFLKIGELLQELLQAESALQGAKEFGRARLARGRRQANAAAA